jgi:hypothetical protein
LSSGPAIIVSHTPEFRDLALFWLATKLVPRTNTVAVVLFRRGADGIVGTRNRRAWFLERVIPGLIRAGRIYPVSDSRIALDAWTAGTGAKGSLIAIPQPLGATSRSGANATHGGLVVGLVGRARIEKGAHLYDSIIRDVLAINEGAKVRVQVFDSIAGEEGQIAKDLVLAWAGHPRVELLKGHLTPEAYADLVQSSDVVMLPYDPVRYGNGTSGVMHDTLAAGGVVLATSIEWGRAMFGDRDDVVWLRGLDPTSIRAGLEEALELAHARRSRPKARGLPNTFRNDWLTALERAAEQMRSR